MDARTHSATLTSMRSWVDSWPLFLGFAFLAIPTIASLARQQWATEAGAHAPLLIVTAAWLAWRRMHGYCGSLIPGRGIVTAALILPALFIYTFGRAYDFISLEVGGLYVAGIAMLYSQAGSAVVKHLWFPLFYLMFAFPIPGWLLAVVTAPLKELASSVTTQGLQAFGLPIVREGVTIYVAQYQLLVEDACAGMNAIMGLTSIGLFYAYLQRGSSWRYSLLLVAFILPIAVLANIIRITILVLLTYYAGNEAAQGFLHGAAGLVMFASALFLVFAVDTVLSQFLWRRKANT